MKRRYPLFIIDSSRNHGRESETDYISCTSQECPFIAKVNIIEEEDYQQDHESNDLVIYSNTVKGLYRMKIEVFEVGTYDRGTLRALLQRALKEMFIRRAPGNIDYSDLKNTDVIKFCDMFIEQLTQSIRKGTAEDVELSTFKILQKIKHDYEGFQ